MFDLNKKLSYDNDVRFKSHKYRILPLSKEGLQTYISKDNVTTHKYLDKFHPKIMKDIYEHLDYAISESNKHIPCYAEPIHHHKHEHNHIPIITETTSETESNMIQSFILKTEPANKAKKKHRLQGILYYNVPRVDNNKQKNKESLYSKNMKKTIEMTYMTRNYTNMEEAFQKENERIRSLIMNFKPKKNKLSSIK
jgi:hypothetical protein